MSVHPFAGLNAKPSPWGYNWKPSETPTAAYEQPKQLQPPQQPVQVSDEILVSQYANLPAALLNSLKRDKKPFTYTPGGVDLGEVLSARLQKRAERKKRYSEEKTNNKQVMVMPTYNTPLEMYSTENALQMLEAQAGLVAEDKSLSASSPSRSATLPRNHTFRFDEDGKGVTQSKAFRVLQIITDTEEENPKDRSSGHGLEEETRWRGIRERGEIPSRFFHTLQKITGTEGDEEPSRTPQPQTGPAHYQVFQPAAAPPPSSGLKRPAAFLPIKTTPGFRSVPPPNGPLRHPAVGTDF